MMTRSTRSSIARTTLGLILGLLWVAPGLGADKLPPLWGYGVKSCSDYLGAAKGWEAGIELQIAEYRRYEDWLTGFVSGLNLATGQDVLKGAEIEAAMRRTRAYCEGNRRSDFFNATMDFVRMLSRLR